MKVSAYARAQPLDDRAEPARDKQPGGFKAVIGKVKVAQKRPAADTVPDRVPPTFDPATPVATNVSRATSQIGGLCAAAVGRAIAALGAALGQIAGSAQAPEVAAQAPAAQPLPPTAELPPPVPFTPLEQAVHDLIEQLQSWEEPAADRPAPAQPVIAHADFAPVKDAPAPSERPAPVAPLREIQLPPEPLQSPSHVHLVLDDGPERVVMTVAVRGSEVNVALRGSHDATAAALARNAASLDHALRARGLDLTDFSAERDPEARRAPQREQREREDHSNEAFDLEEHA